ncbi:ABC transporter permease [Gallibacterium salpingitidis]|uniref:ABC transporter permease n=1 Tax=Gallibacterium salpingitidis TaxID=505341 RepID=UPI00266F476F|nr:ABC transporter permease [Gallibacterium salpingitidis]WKT00460.1 ABC transporter permease [Gallibacterium salpingitidis]
MNIFHDVWLYRFFILSSIKTEFKSRFVRSRLGGIWMIIHPLAQVAIYALVLSAVLSAKLPGITNRYAYAIYLMSGTMCWSLFSEILGRCLNIFISNGNLIKKMSFPKIALPLIVIGSSLINNLLMFLAILIVFGVLGHISSVYIFWLPLLLIMTVLLGAGLGTILGIINVFIRDTGQIVQIVLNFWFWLTPVVYIADMLPESYRHFFYYNPMYGIVRNYQNIMAYDKNIDFSILIYPVFFIIISLFLAIFMYIKGNEDMADVL